MVPRPQAAQMKGRQRIGGGDSWELRVRTSDFGSEDHEMPLHILELQSGHRARGCAAAGSGEACAPAFGLRLSRLQILAAVEWTPQLSSPATGPSVQRMPAC